MGRDNCFMMKRLIFPILALLLAGCSKDIDFEALEKGSAEDIFALGKTEMAAKNYTDAVKIFEELERLHPYSKLTADAQLAAGDCNYKAGKFIEASSSYEIFVKTHPIHSKVPYAVYMLGEINFEQMPIVSRDQEPTVLALQYFNELCTRFPTCEYVKDAKAKIAILENQIAAREVFVARYYQDRKNYAAAAGRLNSVIDNYSHTEHAPEAMHRLVECYTAMGFDDQARLVNEVLQSRHKGTSWAEYSRNLLSGTRNR